MKSFSNNLCCLLMLGFYTVSANSAELLGRISDETAQVAEPAQQSATQNKGQIIYRVICPAGGEVLPECEQAPVADALDDKIPAAAEAEAKPENAAASSEKQLKAVAEDLPKSNSHKPVKVKKTVADKKHAKKKAAKTAKNAKKSVKPSKRKHK
jgi:hypothetical protein